MSLRTPWNGADPVLSIHPTPVELILAAFVASMALLVLLADFWPPPGRRDTDEAPGTDEPDSGDDVRQPEAPEQSGMTTAA